MNLHWIDWTIWGGLSALIVLMALSTRKYNQCAADFLAANRSAGKYLLAVGDGMASLGAITIVGNFQQHFEGGFTPVWWQLLLVPMGLLLSITGWVIYRFRQTRALTMAQFFEIRYSRNVRVFAGILAFVSGLINFGIFPAVGARFFIYFCGFPFHFSLLGIQWDTFAVIMIILIGIALAFTWVGGQVAVMVTDFCQGIICYSAFVVILLAVIRRFHWGQIAETLLARPEQQSMLNPYKIKELVNYNLFFYLIMVFDRVYGMCSWQGQQAYNSAALDPHHAKMSKVLSYLRILPQMLFVMFLPVCAYTLMHHAGFRPEAASVEAIVSSVNNNEIVAQITTPVAILQVLPVGAIGLMCALMFCAFISTHDTYLHSWGSIFLQDIILPFRRTPFAPKTHMRLLRLSTLGVAVFIFLFSYFLVQRINILMFFALTGSIFLGSSGSLIIGGLYWKRATSAGAWTSMIVGLIMSSLGFVLVQFWVEIASLIRKASPGLWPELQRVIPAFNENTFIFSAQEMFFFTMISCLASFVIVSLLTCKKPYNMDRMLHRGRYAIADDTTTDDVVQLSNWQKAVGYHKGLQWDDKLILIASYSFVVLSLLVFAAGTLWQVFYGVPDKYWLVFWRVLVGVFLGFCIVIPVWLGIGGIVDLRRMFRLLSTMQRDHTDDGSVNHEALAAADREGDSSSTD